MLLGLSPLLFSSWHDNFYEQKKNTLKSECVCLWGWLINNRHTRKLLNQLWWSCECKAKVWTQQTTCREKLTHHSGAKNLSTHGAVQHAFPGCLHSLFPLFLLHIHKMYTYRMYSGLIITRYKIRIRVKLEGQVKSLPLSEKFLYSKLDF